MGRALILILEKGVEAPERVRIEDGESKGRDVGLDARLE